MRSLARTDAILVILFLGLLTFPLLYGLRAYDDNTLTSWRWVFAQVGPVPVFLLLVPAFGLAFVLSRIGAPERFEPVLLFVLAAAAVVPLWSGPEPIIDASRYFLQAAHLEREGAAAFLRDWGRDPGAWTDLPLVPFLYGMLFRIFGEERAVIQSFTTLLFALTAVLTRSLGRRLGDRETGSLAGLLLLAMPYLLVQAPLMLADVPALFLFTLSLSAWLTALDRGGPVRIAAAAVAIACAALAKYSVWPMLPALPLITFIRMREGRAGALPRSLAVLALAAVLTAAVLLPRYELVLDQLELLRSYQLPALGRWRESAVSTFLFQLHPFIAISAAAGALRAVRERDPRFLLPGWFVLCLVLLPGERIRYLLPLLPLYSLMAAYGLRALFEDAESRRFAATIAVAASLVLVLAAYRPFLDRTTMANLRDAGAYLDTLPGDAVMVQVMPQSVSTGNTEMAVPLLDLYTRKRLVYDRRPLERPDDHVIARAPLRFTWELRLPASYGGFAGAGRLPRVVISDDPARVRVPRESRGLPASPKVFAADTGSFRFRTAVTIVP